MGAVTAPLLGTATGVQQNSRVARLGSRSSGVSHPLVVGVVVAVMMVVAVVVVVLVGVAG